MPSFVLDSDNLDNYRPWLRRAREWARKQGGDVMEQHLIGQIVPAEELTDEAIATADAKIIGSRMLALKADDDAKSGTRNQCPRPNKRKLSGSTRRRDYRRCRYQRILR